MSAFDLSRFEIPWPSPIGRWVEARFSSAATLDREQTIPVGCAGKQPKRRQEGSVTQMPKGHLGGHLR
jgi:hypothetical protein